MVIELFLHLLLLLLLRLLFARACCLLCGVDSCGDDQ